MGCTLDELVEALVEALAHPLADASPPVVVVPAPEGDGAGDGDGDGDGDGPGGACVISGITHDSRRVTPGSVFCCVPGATADGHDYAAAAVEAGAMALLVERVLPVGVAQVVVPSVRVAMGYCAAAVFGHPASRLTMVGVTGTNGKTTVTSLIAGVLAATGRSVGMIGTLTGTHTTPEAPDLQAALAGFVASGRDTVAMEVSSHALALHRVNGAHFDVAVFTNLGRDHLDLHETMEQYFAAKAALFEPRLSAHAVINVDDVHGRLLADTVTIPVTRISRSEATDVQVGATRLSFQWRGQRFDVPLGGGFNVDNAMAAAAACAVLGVPLADIAAAMAAVPAVPGRFEAIEAGQGFDVVVDFAHTPDGLHAALQAGRDAVPGRVIVVFGAGGDRDPHKRPLMGAAAARWADVIVVTSDNPRSEDPSAIIDAIAAGIPANYRGQVVIQPDRRTAFVEAFALATGGDLVIIAGKGHETTQTVGTKVYEFDDRAVARQLLETGR